ncbi:MAG: histidinol-phosphate transaminase [Armatimonadota bacterium]|nr:histidinol-phosphate transaminase [Armatimonadota bacterium]MDW8155351.1 histidinol-phosphate transaminase [Armatimonadota bacterium]
MTPRPRPEVAQLQGYRLTGADVPVKLNQNECPHDVPPQLKEEIVARLRALPWNRYPPMRAEAARQAVASACGVSPDRVLLTNGSNEAILALVQTFACGRTVVLPEPGYSMAAPLAVVGGARVQPVRLREDLTVDVDALARTAREVEAALVFLASPNNPTGRAVPPQEVEALLESFAGPVVVDEAYWGFCPWSVLPLQERHRNLVVLRTASKAFGLAGARVGWMVAHPEVVAEVGKVVPPYNVNLFAQAAVEVMARQGELVAQRVQEVVEERQRLYEALRGLGVQVYPSDANFLLFRVPDAPQTFRRLAERGVLVRDVSRYPMLGGCLRVTVGSRDENDAFLAALQSVQEVVV